MADDRQREPIDLAWVLCVATAGAVPFLRGGVDELTVIGAAALSLVAFVLEHLRKPGGFTKLMPRALWPLLAACVWQTALLVPLKVQSSSLRAFVWQALADPPQWAPTALNPAALAIDVVRLWTVLLFAMTIAHRTGRGRTNLGLFWALTVSGVAQIALGPFMDGAGFVNPNHRAAYFTLTSICAASVALMSRRQASRGVALIVSGIAMGAVIFTLSRAGIAAAVLGMATFSALLRPRGGGRRALTPILMVGFAAAIAVYVLTGPLGARFQGRTEEKTRVWGQALRVAAQHPVGTGRTGFALAFDGVREADKEGGRWDYVENTYLQAFTDYGPVGGAAAIACWLWLSVRVVIYARKRPPGGLRSPRRAAVAAILVALSAHAIFDFNWEMLGIALPVWMLIAALGRPGEQPFQASAFAKRGVREGWVLVAALCVMAPALMYGLRYIPRRLDALAADVATRTAALLDLVRTRPLDAWALVALGDDALAKKDAKGAIVYLNRAVLVAPNWGEPHLSLARVFCAANRTSQAHIEMKLALERMRGGEQRVFSVLARCLGDEIEDAFPEGRHTVWHEAVSWSIANDATALTQAIAAVYRGAHPPTLQRLASDARRRGDREAWEKWLKAFVDPNDPLRLSEIAEDAVANDRPDDAVAALEAALAKDDPALRLRLVQVLIAKGDLARAEAEAGPLAEACAYHRQSSECRGYRLARATIAMQARRPLDALEQYKTILLTAPEDVEVTLLATTALETLGDVKEAIELLRKNEKITSHPVIRQRREALETPR